MENDEDMIRKASESYITKEELIKTIENLSFVKVKACRLEAITGFKIEEDSETNKKYPTTLGFEIEIY